MLDRTHSLLPKGSSMAEEERGDESIIIISSSSGGVVANSLSSLVSDLMKDFDSRSEATTNTQHLLHSSLDRLNGELDRLLEDAPLPFIMQHAARISGVRERVRSLNSVLKSVQRRIDNVDRLLSAGVLQDKVAKDSSGQQ